MGTIAKKDVQVTTDFGVADGTGSPVTGLVDGNFTKELYDPNGNEDSGSITVTVSELGGGAYRVTFTPDEVGDWILRIFHATHFPWGKSENFDVQEVDWSDIETMWHLLGGGWKIDESTKEMIFYKADNSTVVATFDLKDINGAAAYIDVFQRDRQ